MQEIVSQPHALFTLACAALMVVTSLVHSILGEKRLIGPLLQQSEGVLRHGLARFLIRSVWHFMTVLFWIIAASLIAGLNAENAYSTPLLFGVCLGIGGAGVYDAIGSRGRHIGWPLLVLIGILAALALWVRP